MAMGVRPWSVRLHRWVGLVLGAWFALVGLTGTVLVWHGELDRALNPGWFAPLADCAAASATPIADVLKVYARHRPDAATQVMRPESPGAAYVVWSRPGERRLQHFVDPDCGRYLGLREWGAPRTDRAHLVPALYELHRSLLSGEAGHVLVGLGGGWLLFLALSGLINAWPRRSSREAWRRVLTVRRDAARSRLYYDLHRAVGLWLVPFLLLMSLTGLYLCFPNPARALLGRMLPMQPEAVAMPASNGAAKGPDALAGLAESRFTAAAWTRVQLPKNASSPVDVRLLQEGEMRKDTGDTRVRLHADGSVLQIRDPLRSPAGDRLVALLFPLHSGEALALPGRVLWTLSGLLPALLFVTGAWLWLHRRRRALRPARHAVVRANARQPAAD